MGRLIFGMMQSLDGYIDGPAENIQLGPPDPIVFRHFIDHIRGMDSILYGRRMYEVMRYWDADKPDWNDDERAFAQAWRPTPKWVASRSVTSIGPNAILVQGDVVDLARRLKAERKGDIDLAGAELASALSAAGLVDEYHLYFRPQVLGAGKAYFAGPVPPLSLRSVDRVGEDVVHLIYVPA